VLDIDIGKKLQELLAENNKPPGQINNLMEGISPVHTSSIEEYSLLSRTPESHEEEYS